ncbi:MAG: hypothetical protein IJ192_11945 [Clostridia bacterium]|nr:hypothetical protein [Clostridia bacterium]
MSDFIRPNPPFPPTDPGTLKKIVKGVVKVGKKVIEGIVNIGKTAWEAISGEDETQEEISRKKGFDPEKSEATDIAELNRLLNEYRTNISSAANDLEREMIIEYTEELKEIMNLFEEYNKELKVIRSETVKRRFKRMNNEIKGTFEEYISKRISLDDPEFVKILKLPAGELKNQRLQEIKQKVFIEAGNEIVRKIKNAVDEFSDTVEDAFYEHLERAEQTVAEKNEAFENLTKVSDEDTESTEAILIRTDYIISVCSFANSLD